MDGSHRANVLVTSCLRTPVDPLTKAPVALYEREGAARRAGGKYHEKEMEYDSGSELGAGDPPAKESSPLLIKDYRVTGDHIDLREFYFSNEEYYRKLEQLKTAHLRTMAELELMYRKKLELKGVAPLERPERANQPNLLLPGNLKKAHSAYELRRDSAFSDTDEEERTAADEQDARNGHHVSPRERIKNMWQDFSVDRLSPRRRHSSVTSTRSHPGERRVSAGDKVQKAKARKPKKRKQAGQEEGWGPRATVPKPFRMMLREAERKRKGIRSRTEVERENAELRQQLEELTECRRKFRASPAPAHVRLPLYEELRGKDKERRGNPQAREQERLGAIQKPFSFLERERLKKEQREAQLREQTVLLAKEEEDRRRRPFRAKPVPRGVKEAASGEQQKEEQLYRSIKMQMRARELLLSSAMPPSELSKRLGERNAKKAATRNDRQPEAGHCPKISTQVPDFDASYKRFQSHLASKRDVRPATACEPFQLRTANIASHKERVMADIDAEIRSPRATRWPFIIPLALSPRTPSSSVCSSLSGSQECLPAKITDAAKKRQEAIRKVLEQRKKAEEEEERWRDRQRQREKKLQKVISKRAQANDTHVALAQTCQSKLKEFRKQDIQRRREYREEMKEIQERVKSRPLLLEQVAQMNAKQAAEKRYAEALRGCGLNEAFISSKAPQSRTHTRDSTASDPSDRYTPHTLGEHQEAADLASGEEESLPGDYPADYEEYEQDVEAEMMEGENAMEEEEDDQSDPELDGDGHRSREDDQDLSCADDSQGTDDEGSDMSRHSDNRRESGEEGGLLSPSRDGGRESEDGESRQSSRASSRGEEVE